MAKQNLTSITQTKADAFLKSAAERETLACDNIRGFHLMKTQRGASWRYRYSVDGQRKVATIGTYAQMKPAVAADIADRWRLDKVDPLAEAESKRAERQDERRKSKARTLRAYLDGAYGEYQAEKRDGEATIDRIRHSFEGWLDRDMASLTKRDVKDWNAAARKRGLVYATRQRSFGALKTLLNHAVKEDEVLSVNPLANVTLPAPTPAEKEKMHDPEAAAHRRLLTDAELTGIHAGLEGFAEEIRAGRRNSRAHGKAHLPDLDAVAYPHWFIPFCLVALHTGLRPGDIYSLKWTHLDLKFSKTLRKTPEKTMHHKNPPVINLPLSDEIIDILTRWHKQQGKPKDGLVFPSPVSGNEIDHKSHAKPWRKVRKAGGLGEGLHFYSLRHHFISTLVAAGVPLMTVAQMVGHRSTAMIEAHYGHLCKHTAAEAMQAYSASLTVNKQREATA